jgi:large conductance mechanosensitive channel
MLKDFKEFVMRGNVVDMAVGIIIGAAFGTIVSSLVKDIIMPPISLLTGSVDFNNLFWVMKKGDPTPAGTYDYTTLDEAHSLGATTLNYGAFINTVIVFIIVAFAVFLLIRAINNMRRRAEAPKPAAAPTTKDCPYCVSKIPLKATRCPNCTSELKTA